MHFLPKTWFIALAVGATAILIHADVARAESPDATFHRAYYLEQERGDPVAAAKLYEQVVQADGTSAELKARAQARLATFSPRHHPRFEGVSKGRIPTGREGPSCSASGAIRCLPDRPVGCFSDGSRTVHTQCRQGSPHNSRL